MMTIRHGEGLATNVGENVAGENVGEHTDDLIRRGKEQEAFIRLKAELAQAFAQPDTSYRPLTAADIIRRTGY